MKYEQVQKGIFIERPNRFIAYVEIEGRKETVHVKNTGRCRELLIPGAVVYVQKADQGNRKTLWDLIAVEKGDRLINMDSQAPNKAVREWMEESRKGREFFPGLTCLKAEYPFGNSRIDLYAETEEKKILIEVKGVTLEENGTVRFPDAPSERAVKHLEELTEAVKKGYEAWVFFVIQMKDVAFFTPNTETHPAFANALRKAAGVGVHVTAWDCEVTYNSMYIRKEVPVVLGDPVLFQIRRPLIDWYRKNQRDLPWRENPDAYRVWVSEIMLQQTRVEAVRPYYQRFLEALPDVKALAEAPEDLLLKLWEGLGYYNRVRNMQEAARQIVKEYGGVFPEKYEEILSLKGIGSYTAGAISAFAFGNPEPAVDGNVLRVLSRIRADEEDIMKASARKKAEHLLREVIPKEAASDFNQGLIEIGALVCLPGGEPKCRECPLAFACRARARGIQNQLPVRSRAKERKKEKKTVFIFRDGETAAIKKRPKKGLLAGLYELPNVEGHLTVEEAVAYSKKMGLYPVRIKKLGTAKHVFSHVEWDMVGYLVQVDELEKSCGEEMIFIHPEEAEAVYPIPAAFEKYAGYLKIRLGNERYK